MGHIHTVDCFTEGTQICGHMLPTGLAKEGGIDARAAAPAPVQAAPDAFAKFDELRKTLKEPGYCAGTKYTEREAFDMAVQAAPVGGKMMCAKCHSSKGHSDPRNKGICGECGSTEFVPRNAPESTSDAGELPPLPEPTIEGSVMHPELKICYRAPVHFTADQMRAYVLADRAAAEGRRSMDRADMPKPVIPMPSPGR